MAFFLVMSVVPFLFWLTLLFGKLNIDYTQLLELEIFSEVKDVFLYLRDAAQSATAGASVVAEFIYLSVQDWGKECGLGQSADTFAGRACVVRVFGIRKFRFDAATVRCGGVSDRVSVMAVYPDDLFCDRRYF